MSLHKTSANRFIRSESALRFNDTDNQYSHCDLSHHSTFILIYSVILRGIDNQVNLKRHATSLKDTLDKKNHSHLSIIMEENIFKTLKNVRC